MAKKSNANEANSSGNNLDSGSKKSRLSQTDVPNYTLEQALEVPKAISDNFAGNPTKPLHVAHAMEVQPSSGGFRGKCGAAIAYGLTKGGSNADEIIIEDLGMRIVRPLEEGDDFSARREALLKPRVIGEFLQKYNGSPLPRPDIAKNVLIDMGVPQNKLESVLSLIETSAEAAGFLIEIKGKKHVDLEGVIQSNSEDGESSDHESPQHQASEESEQEATDNIVELHDRKHEHSKDRDEVRELNKRRVFITHGKNKEFIEPIKKLLGFGELEAVVSGQRQSVSQPVPDKVMNDMRSCGAAIIHVDVENKLLDQEANEHTVLNHNVLIEIGAAMALYGRRYILLVRNGISLPSNLQGLYEVRYAGDTLDGEATIKLLEAINDIKNHTLPARYSSGKSLDENSSS